jgi:glycosyltransferase involved in cell wall biosynthesis
MKNKENEFRNGTGSAQCDLTIMVPALNEEGNLHSTLEMLLAEITRSRINVEVFVVNDGSKDGTGKIAERFAETDSRVSVINHQSPQGIGASFMESLKQARGEYITWFPGDGENNPRELLKYFGIKDYVDIIIPFVVNMNVRTRLRQIISSVFIFIVNLSFGTRFNYTNGNNIYRTEFFKKINIRNTGFLFSTEILLKLTKAGAIYAEVPVRIEPGGRKSGSSKAFSLRSVIGIMSGFIRLFFEVNFRSRTLVENE